MGKFFFAPSDKDGDKVHLVGDAAHYVLKVLRLSVGDKFTLCDGKNTDYAAQLVDVSVKPPRASFLLGTAIPCNTELPFEITLYQGIPKKDKLDWIIEKCVELGACKIVPVYTARTVIKPKDASKKFERYQRIAESAACQSMRGIVPAVCAPISFAEAVSNNSNCHKSICIVPYENEKIRSIKSTISNITPRPVSIWIGPEGGFDKDEIDNLTNVSAIPITLGPRILRTETAGMATIAQILCMWGE